MQASDYIRKSPAAQAMTAYCREHGFSFAVEPPGSKGHPFLVVSVNGERVRQPFSMTPSETKRCGKNAVRDLKMALRERDLIDAYVEEEEVEEVPEIEPLRTNSDGVPLWNKSLSLDKNGYIATGDRPENREYIQAREQYIIKCAKRGDTAQQIADALTAGGVKCSFGAAKVKAYKLRRKGLIPMSWTSSGGKSFAQEPQKVSSETNIVLSETNSPKAQDVVTPNPLNGAFSDLVTQALRKARLKSAQEADAMAADWIEKIASARKTVEVERVEAVYESRYMGVLEALTQQ